MPQDAGDYEVVLWDSGSGTGMMYFWNYDYPDTTPADKKIRDLYRNPKFKQAMSLALDRPTIQKTVYYDTGILTTGTMSPKAFEFNFNAEAQAFCQKARRHLCRLRSRESQGAARRNPATHGEDIRQLTCGRRCRTRNARTCSRSPRRTGKPLA